MSPYLEALNRRGRDAARRFGLARSGQASAGPNGPAPRAARPAPAISPPRVMPEEIRSAYGTLREKLLLAANGEPLKALVFAGCAGGEGCTQVVREFAETLAGSGLNVLLLDAGPRSSGLGSSLASTGADLSQLVATGGSPPGTPWGKGRLAVVPGPVCHPDEERFFARPEFAVWLDRQRGAYDYVLIDAPPLLRVADGTLIGRTCDGVVIIARGGATERESLVRAREQLERAEARVLGVVLNRMRDPVPAFLRPFLSPV